MLFLSALLCLSYPHCLIFEFLLSVMFFFSLFVPTNKRIVTSLSYCKVKKKNHKSVYARVGVHELIQTGGVITKFSVFQSVVHDEVWGFRFYRKCHMFVRIS